LDDVLDGHLLRDLPDLRVAGAGWTLLNLRRRLPGHTMSVAAWREASRLLTVAAAQDLRVAARLPAEAYLPYGDGTPSDAQTAAQWIGRWVASWWVAPPSRALSPATQQAAQAAAGEVAAGRPVLVELADSAEPSVDGHASGWLLPLAPAAGPPGGPFPLAMRVLAARTGALTSAPVWLWAPLWPLERLTGLEDRAAALAVSLACLRALPNTGGAGWGQLRDTDQGLALLSARPALRREFLAFAVHQRMLSGLGPEGVETPRKDLFVLRFGDGRSTVRVAWSEGGPLELRRLPGEQVTDHLGGVHVAEPIVTLGRAPVYLVRRTAAAGP
jgi:hypothetical protein